jgi:hypothetical protein
MFEKQDVCLNAPPQDPKDAELPPSSLDGVPVAQPVAVPVKSLEEIPVKALDPEPKLTLAEVASYLAAIAVSPGAVTSPTVTEAERQEAPVPPVAPTPPCPPVQYKPEAVVRPQTPKNINPVEVSGGTTFSKMPEAQAGALETETLANLDTLKAGLDIQAPTVKPATNPAEITRNIRRYTLEAVRDKILTPTEAHGILNTVDDDRTLWALVLLSDGKVTLDQAERLIKWA